MSRLQPQKKTVFEKPGKRLGMNLTLSLRHVRKAFHKPTSAEIDSWRLPQGMSFSYKLPKTSEQQESDRNRTQEGWPNVRTIPRKIHRRMFLKRPIYTPK